MDFLKRNAPALGGDKQHGRLHMRMLGMVLLDALLLAAANALAILLRFESGLDAGAASHSLAYYLQLQEVVYLSVFFFGRLYQILWKYAGFRELAKLCTLCAVSCGICYIINDGLDAGLSRSVLVIGALIAAMLMSIARLGLRSSHYIRQKFVIGGAKPRRLMVVGAGSGGAYVINLCNKDVPMRSEPVLIVDDDPGKLGLRLQNVPIRGTSRDIPALAEKHKIQEIIIAISAANIADMNGLVGLCKQTSCRIRILSGIQGVDNLDDKQRLWLRDLDLSDLLMRGEEQFDLSSTGAYLNGKTVLVTGGGGSIGSELCRQVMRFSPKLLIVYDNYENNAYALECELKQAFNGKCRAKVAIGSIRDRKRLDEVFDAYKPEVVFHAAAHKHVPLMETSYGEAVKNNVLGTRNLLEACEAHGVERFVMLSTDKAVNPTNIMGATKRINEMMVQVFAKTSTMKCMMVRFGNVLGSHGSVVPLFEMQIKNGGPVTITHPDIVRYFMTIPEAAQLVLQAGAFAESGALYALDMGEPIRILDLAEKIIRFYGFEPNVDMPIKIIGLRPGEKLYEELLSDEERARLIATRHKKIFVVPTAEFDAGRFAERLAALEREVEGGSTEGEERRRLIQSLIRELVPGYQPGNPAN